MKKMLAGMLLLANLGFSNFVNANPYEPAFRIYAQVDPSVANSPSTIAIFRATTQSAPLIGANPDRSVRQLLLDKHGWARVMIRGYVRGAIGETLTFSYLPPNSLMALRDVNLEITRENWSHVDLLMRTLMNMQKEPNERTPAIYVRLSEDRRPQIIYLPAMYQVRPRDQQ